VLYATAVEGLSTADFITGLLLLVCCCVLMCVDV